MTGSKLEDIARFAFAMNAAWREERFDDLGAFFDPNVVMYAPTAGIALQGREAMVASYRQFSEMGTIHSFEFGELSIHDFDGVAMCHLPFDVDYEVENGRFQESGVDIYAIDTRGEGMRIVWRSQVPVPPAQS